MKGKKSAGAAVAGGSCKSLEGYINALEKKCELLMKKPDRHGRSRSNSVASVTSVSSVTNKEVNPFLKQQQQQQQQQQKQQQQHQNKTLEKPTSLTYINFYQLLTRKWNVSELKQFAKQHKLKISGNKNELLQRLFVHMKLSKDALVIQKLFRGHMQRKFNTLHGPAALMKNRGLCNNPDDFLTGESMQSLPYDQFYSYKDADGFIYGFDILSITNLIQKSATDKEVKNPYNRNVLPQRIQEEVKSYVRMSRIMKIDVNVDIKKIDAEVTEAKSHELCILDLFQHIDSLGNYSQSSWFTDLNHYKLGKFVRELYDIWNYRAQIEHEVKKKICPPHGNPFTSLNIHRFSLVFNPAVSIESVQKCILPVLELLVKSGVDKDSKALGAYYILGALTIVNENAAMALPWLYQSFSYF